MTNRAHLAARRYTMPAGFVDAVSVSDLEINDQPNIHAAHQETATEAGSDPVIHKADLVAKVAGATGLSKREVETVMSATFVTISDALSHGVSVKVVKFGTFRARSARIRRFGEDKVGRGKTARKRRVNDGDSLFLPSPHLLENASKPVPDEG